MSVESVARRAFALAVDNAAHSSEPVGYPIGDFAVQIPNENLDEKRRNVLLDSYSLLWVVVRNGISQADSAAHDVWYMNAIHTPARSILARMDSLPDLTPAEHANRALIARFC